MSSQEKAEAGERRSGSRPREGYHHGDLRRALLDEALPLIAERGLEGFTLRELARRVGVTHGAAYRHFGDKRALLSAIALEGHADFAAALRAAIAERDDVVARIEALVDAWVVWALDHPAAYAVMFGPRMNEDGRHPELERAIAGAFTQVDALFVDAGFAKDRARTLSIALLTQAHGFVDLVRLRRVRVRSRAATRALAKDVMGPFVRGVAAEVAALDG